MSRMEQIRDLLDEAEYYEGLAAAEQQLVSDSYPMTSQSWVDELKERAGRALEEALYLSCTK